LFDLDETERVSAIIFDFDYQDDQERPSEETCRALAWKIVTGNPPPEKLFGDLGDGVGLS